MVRGGRAARALCACRGAVLCALGVACSGEPFHLAADALGSTPDSGTFPPLVTDSNPPDTDPDAGGAGGTTGAGAGGTGGSAGATTPPPAASPCGTARVGDDELADDEVCVRAGSFDMGSTQPATSGYFAHAPVHTVTLTAFFLDAYEVTVARYRRCVEAGACTAPNSAAVQGCTYTAQPQDHELHPVTCVSWQMAQDFCSWDGGRQLPTEAQWEQAARNTAGSKYPWGDAFSCDRAVLAGASQCPAYSGQLPQPVGSARAGASPERVYDLSGNAAEWVADWFGGYTASAATDPTGPATGSIKIQRGGSWLTIAADAGSYARRGEVPAAIGPFSFRCARAAEP